MDIRVVGTALLLFGAMAFADDADRSRLIGSWESGNSDADRVTWVLEAKGDGSLHIVNMQGNQKLAEFVCDTDGHECTVKASGHNAKVSLWYNGSKLVEMETKGSDVVKRRFAVAGEGQEMDIEIIPIVSTTKAETLHFKRAKGASPAK